MSRSMPYHRRYHNDALQGYRKLTLEERGAYTTILDLIYDNFGPIENNERWLAGEFGVSTRLCRTLIQSLIAKQKIYITSDKKISNHRCEEEIVKSLETSKKNAVNGSKKSRKENENSELHNEYSNSTKPSLSERLANVPHKGMINATVSPQSECITTVASEIPSPTFGGDAPEENSTVADIEKYRAEKLRESLERMRQAREKYKGAG